MLSVLILVVTFLCYFYLILILNVLFFTVCKDYCGIVVVLEKLPRFGLA
jgi:hypothetical protein